MPSITKLDTGGEISYPVREQQITVTHAEYAVIRLLTTVQATKFIRDQYKLGLFEAKQVVDTVNLSATNSLG